MSLEEDFKGMENANCQMVPVKCGPSQQIVATKDSERSENSVVRSAAEVRHGTIHFLAQFSPLQLNTNLNIPPSNWLRSSSKLEQRVRDLTWQSKRKPSEFSSFQMANNSLDLTGEVDVITNAENLKNLLKIPFSKHHVSMMVHRIGKSLLIDQFDIHKHLLRKEQNDWRWLRQFYYEHVMQEKMKCVPRENKSRHNLSNRNMYSKFLYHSLVDAQEKTLETDVNNRQEAEEQLLLPDPLPQEAEEQLLQPDPLPQAEASENHREVLWTFEDIKMLIGTDLPIFCHDSYYVSLRLRDMRTPINVLTGLDYWLDNLMCNVPEIAMCFHINGIVKKYEVLKTEDIPCMENSKFDPQVVTDIAKNILSFLKTNATREGHTYWLYKGVDDDVVKLYDLTALCADSLEELTDNPFSVPVGMLLYRLARNLRINHGPHKVPVIRTLLETCLFLLDENQHSQVCTSASYLLSDLFVPDSSLQDDWAQSSSDSETDDGEEYEQEGEEESESTNTNSRSVDVDTLCMNSNENSTRDLVRLKPITENTEQRCKEALKFINRGLTCLDRDLHFQQRPQSSIVEEQAQCNSDEPIPMHYEPLHKAGSSQSQEASLDDSACILPLTEDQTWHCLSKTLLYRKAALTFFAMSKLFMSQKQYVEALRCLRSAFYSYSGMECLMPQKAAENLQLLACMYGLAGDIHLIVSKLTDLTFDLEHMVKTASVEESSILDCVEEDVQDFRYRWVMEGKQTVEDHLQCCVQCYERALEVVSSSKQEAVVSLSKRLGNAQNETGVFYMQRAQLLLQEEELGDRPSAEMHRLWQTGQRFLECGVATFQGIRDTANEVLLYCNCGRLMRLCARTYTHIMCNTTRQEFTEEERKYFLLAIENYKSALRVGQGQAYRTIRDSVMWELSTTYFNMATLLQDYAPLSTASREEIEKEIIDLMNKSLKFCRTDVGQTTQPMYQYRAATINHRLASLFHNAVRSQQCTEQRRKHLRQLAENHYERASRQFRHMECGVEALRVQLERVALLELSLAAQVNPRNRIRQLLHMLHLMMDCDESLRSLMKLLDDLDGESNLPSEADSVTSIMSSRLQHFLLELVKAYKSIVGKKSKVESGLLEEVKKLYASSLHQEKTDSLLQTVRGRCQFLLSLLKQGSKFYYKVVDTDSEFHEPSSHR